jgi:hypothetical protein
MTLTILPEILIPQLYICASNTQDFFYNRNYDYYILFYLDQIIVILWLTINLGRPVIGLTSKCKAGIMFN